MDIATDENVFSGDIAIIGMSAKFPGALGVEEFWKNICSGADLIGELPAERKRDAEEYLEHAGLDKSGMCYFKGAFLNEIDKFDYSFFDMSYKDACLMSPEQRLFLEIAWRAVENAGLGSKKEREKTGVFIGFEADDPYNYNRFIEEFCPSIISTAVQGNLTYNMMGRISSLLGLRGPGISVDTACSSALVAVHLACQAIRSGDCELALVGSARVILLPVAGLLNLSIESSDGRARTFDDSADGTGSGEGVAAVVLKPLSRALADGDFIHAVIKGSAVNQDGSSIGITAPNVLAQEDVIASAWKNAGIDPETIAYIEAHGTGTKLGDPIEIDGIQRAFRRYTEKKQFCAVGSVKTNIGHLDNVAGMAGLIKAVLALKEKNLPPAIHFKKPNRKICFEQSPVYVNDSLRKWEAEGFPRRCGVSSFGLSGTNCHIILEEAPEIHTNKKPWNIDSRVLALSAKTRNALLELVKEYNNYLQGNRIPDPDDICATAGACRSHYSHRLAIMFKDLDDLRSKLGGLTAENIQAAEKQGVFYGESEPGPYYSFSREMPDFTGNEIADLCRHYINGAEIDWEKLYRGLVWKKADLPVYPFEQKRCWVNALKNEERYGAHKGLTEYKLLDKLLTVNFGKEVYVKLMNAGREWLLYEHRIMGSCVLVGTAYLEMAMEACSKYLDGGIAEFRDIVFISPLVLNDGEEREIKIFIKKETDCFAFFVFSMQQAEAAGEEILTRHAEGNIYKLAAVQEKIFKTGDVIAKNRNGFTKPDIENYNKLTFFTMGPRWGNIKEIYEGEGELLAHIEMPEEFRGELEGYIIYPSLLDNALTTMPILQKLSGAANYGKGEVVFLPFTYGAFKLEKPLPPDFYSYVKLKDSNTWESEVIAFDILLVDMSDRVFGEITDYTVKRNRLDVIRKNPDPDRMYHTIRWVNKEIGAPQEKLVSSAVLVFKGPDCLTDDLAKKLRGEGRDVIEIMQGEAFGRVDEKRYIVGERLEDYKNLFNAIEKIEYSQIVHMFTLGIMETGDLNQLEERQRKGADSLLYLMKALTKTGTGRAVDILLVSEYVNDVTGMEDGIKPENATLFGLGKAIAQEYNDIKIKFIDIDCYATAGDIAAELYTGGGQPQIAFRQGKRYIPCFCATHIESFRRDELKVKEEGLYVITGGTGGIGLEMAKYLASKGKVTLALINRTSLPFRENWNRVLDSAGDKKTAEKIRAVLEIERTGSRVVFRNVDVSDLEGMKDCINSLRADYGRINGVIHCAGLAGGSLATNMERQVLHEVLAPKVKGTWIIDRLTKEDKPDFLVLCSSVTTIAGAPGQGDYTAANAFQDSYAAFRNKQGMRTLTVNWAGWKETGMAYDHKVNVDGIFKVMTNNQAMRAFDEVINRDVSRIYIGKVNYANLLLTAVGEAFGIELSEEIKAGIGRND